MCNHLTAELRVFHDGKLHRILWDVIYRSIIMPDQHPARKHTMFSLPRKFVPIHHFNLQRTWIAFEPSSE